AGKGIGTAPEPPGAREAPGRSSESRAFGPIHPRLSHAGDQVVFSYQGALWRMPLTGGVMTRLTDGAGFGIEPAWSRDGRRSAFVNRQGFYGGRLRVIRADDGTPVMLPKEVTAAEKLAFDPDGKRVLGTFPISGRGATIAWFDLGMGGLAPIGTGQLRPQH